MDAMTTTGAQQRELLLLDGCRAFNDCDVGGALNIMHTDVDWVDGMTGGRVHGHHALRDHWLTQWTAFKQQLIPLRFTHDADTVMVDVMQSTRTLDGTLLRDELVRHAYTFEGWRVQRMDILATGAPMGSQTGAHMGSQTGVQTGEPEALVVIQAVVVEIRPA